MVTAKMQRIMLELANDTRQDVKQIFTDSLKFIIGNFNPDVKPDPTWRYTKEQNVKFNDLMLTWLETMRQELLHKEWADPWGDVFMSLNVGGNNKAQFFTPDSICDLMADISVSGGISAPHTRCGAFGERVTVSDPTCGSGRNLLAAHTRIMRDGNRKPYLVAEDIDINCCRMTAVNLMAHGCFGEVICHNTLSEPDSLDTGFIINEGLYPLTPGFPTIRQTDDKERFILFRKEVLSE